MQEGGEDGYGDLEFEAQGRISGGELVVALDYLLESHVFVFYSRSTFPGCLMSVIAWTFVVL